jgi:hypothetical protein
MANLFGEFLIFLFALAITLPILGVSLLLYSFIYTLQKSYGALKNFADKPNSSFIRLTITGAGMGCGLYYGITYGAILGGIIGTAVPGIGNAVGLVIGGVIGGVIGAGLGGGLAAFASK